jgi:hypothetical protein
VARRDHDEPGQDEAEQGDERGVLEQERTERHPDVAGLGEIREEHLPEMLVALADEEEIDGRHDRVERGGDPEESHQDTAAGVAREQDEAEDDEQLQAQHRRIEAEPAGAGPRAALPIDRGANHATNSSR